MGALGSSCAFAGERTETKRSHRDASRDGRRRERTDERIERTNERTLRKTKSRRRLAAGAAALLLGCFTKRAPRCRDCRRRDLPRLLFFLLAFLRPVLSLSVFFSMSLDQGGTCEDSRSFHAGRVRRNRPWKTRCWSGTRLESGIDQLRDFDIVATSCRFFWNLKALGGRGRVFYGIPGDCAVFRTLWKRGGDAISRRDFSAQVTHARRGCRRFCIDDCGRGGLSELSAR